jgi:energy-coupling factor transporter ATP-binding protein EcfA2
MIQSLSLTADARVPVSWWNKAFTTAQAWEFKPGVNILWGPNGSGKSTVLSLLARLHCCEHTGYSKVTKFGFSELFSQTKAAPDGSHLPGGVEVQHDGQEVRYFNTGKVIGMEFGMAAFDHEVDDPTEAYLLKGSSGQLNVHRLGKVIGPQLRKKIEWVHPPDPKYRPEPGERDIYHEQQLWLQNYLKGNIKKGAPTVLMDEPDVGMDWPTRKKLWDLILLSSAQKQYIIASHSIFAINYPGAHFLELKPGYLTECRRVVSTLAAVNDFLMKKG